MRFSVTQIKQNLSDLGCHCEERSDVAIRSPFHALITYPLQYGVRIATPVCALARNDMLLSHIKNNLSYQRTIPSMPNGETMTDQPGTHCQRRLAAKAQLILPQRACPMVLRQLTRPAAYIFSGAEKPSRLMLVSSTFLARPMRAMWPAFTFSSSSLRMGVSW